jgi:acetyl-CoA carboxylase carboxyltransferase component
MSPIAVPLRAHVAGSTRAGWRSGDRPHVGFVVDGERRGGALGHADGETIAEAARLALETRVPLVGVMSSSGADVHDGVQALHGWGRAARALQACSGVVPIAFVVSGPVVSGPALLLGLADFVAFTRQASSFVSGPAMVASITGVEVDAATLGGAPVHATRTGVATFVADDTQAGLALIHAALAHLPAHVDDDPPRFATGDAPHRQAPELRELLPASSTGSYDVRGVIEAVVDDGEVLELRAAWAPNLVTALATIGGRPIGIVANQPQSLAGTLDIPASQKGAAFVQMCDAFNVPILTIVDTPGFFPGKDLEWRGMIRHGAQLVHAYAEATVPRICVIVRKAYGGAFIVMDCKSMGNDLCLAWPSAEIAVMGARGAVQILHRGADDDTRAELEAAYERTHLTPWTAAERGLVDAVIDPADTRRTVARGFDMLATKREHLGRRAHSNTPL